MLGVLSGIPTETGSEISQMLSKALGYVPKMNVAEALASAETEKPVRLTSKQTNVVVSVLNIQLKAKGLPPITPEDIIGENVKVASGGCLDPCKGSSTAALLSLLRSRLGPALPKVGARLG